MKRFLKKILIIFLITITLTTVNCYAKDDEELNIKDIVSQEEGSLFDKTIAKTIGGIAQAVYDIVTDENLDIGFKTYEDMLFTGKSPFSDTEWKLMMSWYKAFAYISGTLILIAVIIIAYKMIASSFSTIKRNEAKENLMNLLFGGVAIAVAPIFIKFLIYLNSSLVNILVSIVNGNDLDGMMGNEFLSSITTGNPIATALVISMFIYIFVKLNIKFIVREFTLIVFTIFTPIVVGLWVINKNVTAAAIWSGQIMINVFMQFVYCFLFLLFSTFISANAGWVVTLIWAMMLLPIADVLMNCLQNLTSRIAGVDNNEISMRGIGLGAMLGSGIGYSVNAIKTQFNNQATDGNEKSFIGRVKNFVNPQMKVINENDYSSSTNPVKNVVENKTTNASRNITNPAITNLSTNRVNNVENKSTISKIAGTTYKATKGYLNLGSRMAEGKFDNNSFEKKKDNNNIYITLKTMNEKIDNDKLENKKESDENEEK